MAPRRVTRSSNNSAPRKRYDIDADSVYEPEPAASAKISSDDDATDDTIPAVMSPRSKAKKTLKRKQPATPANRKGKAPAKPSSDKKPRSGLREPSPSINYASMFGGSFGKTPEVELPKVPQSTYAPSEMEEWSQFSNRIIDVLGEQMNGNVDYEADETSSPSGNQSALAVIQQTLREKQAEGSPRVLELGRGRSAASREGSIVWVDTSVMGPRESVRPRADEQLRPDTDLQLRSRISDQRLAEDVYESQMAEGASRGASLGFEGWMGADDQQSPADPEQGSGQSGAGDDPVSEGNDFDVNFDDDHEPPQDVYDLADARDPGDAEPDEKSRVPDLEDEPQTGDLTPVDDSRQNGHSATRETSPDGAQPPQDYEVDQPHEEVYEADHQARAEIREVDQPVEAGNGRAEGHYNDTNFDEGRTRPLRQPAGPQQPPYVEAAEDNIRAVIKSRPLVLILGKFNTEAWTAEGRGWEAEMLAGSRRHLSPLDRKEINEELSNAGRPPLPPGPLAPADMWYAYHRDEVSSEKAREMLQSIYRTWHICREAPGAGDLEAQADYITQGEGKGLRDSIKLCQSYVKYICKRLPAREEGRLAKARQMRKSLYRRLIPLMTMLLKEVFMLASTRAKPKTLEAVQELPEQVDATNFHLQTLLAITEWLQQLSQAMMAEFEKNQPSNLPSDWDTRQKQRSAILPHLKGFKDIIQQAIKQRNEEADEPARKVRASEKDRLERARKQDKLRQDYQAKQQQYQLFQASMQTPSQQKRHIQAAFPASTFVLSQAVPKRKNLSPKEQYALENKGWYWDEDNTLMNALRRVNSPLASGLVHALPGRDEHEVKRRLMELREIGRKHYEGKGTEPPKWCRGYGWR